MNLAIAELMRYILNALHVKRSSDQSAWSRFFQVAVFFFAQTFLVERLFVCDKLALPTLAHTLWLTALDCAI